MIGNAGSTQRRLVSLMIACWLPGRLSISSGAVAGRFAAARDVVRLQRSNPFSTTTKMILGSRDTLMEVCACATELRLSLCSPVVGNRIGTSLFQNEWMCRSHVPGRPQGIAQDIDAKLGSSLRFLSNSAIAAVGVGSVCCNREWPPYVVTADWRAVAQHLDGGGGRFKLAHITGTHPFPFRSNLMLKNIRKQLRKDCLSPRTVSIRQAGIRKHVPCGIEIGGAKELDGYKKCKAVIREGGGQEVEGSEGGKDCYDKREGEDEYDYIEGEEQYLPFWLFNTMKKRKELFMPMEEGKVGMYVCGVTAYDYSHIGHARVYVAFDVLYRYLKHLGYEVTYVRNFTDVDDKIIARAAAIGEDPLSLSTRFCEEFQRDMAALQCLPPSVEPKVSTHITQIIDMIQRIIDNGHGYVVEGGDVFFSVDSLEGYGTLSGRKQEENRAGERVALDERKKNPADFALWKSAKPGEPSWDSPWGAGRPGWHIECSAMSAEHLGHKFDIHGGGRDLIFPHHENELAQSRAACQGSNVAYWVHNGFVTIDSEKMSKSLGNFFTVREVLDMYHPLAVRWFLLGTHYRSPINYAKRQLEEASDRVYYLFQTLQDCDAALEREQAAAVNTSKEPPRTVANMALSLRIGFERAMADDLNTSLAIAALSEPLKAMNDLMHTKKGRKDKTSTACLQAFHEELEPVMQVLGLEVHDKAQVLEELRHKALRRAGLAAEDLAARLQERAAARSCKDWRRADEIRDELAALGIVLMDGGDGTLWKPAPVIKGLPKRVASV